MRKSLVVVHLLVLYFLPVKAQNLLFVPDTLSGTSFVLNIYDTAKVFYPGFSTNTFGVNGAYLGPTLLMNKGDSVNIQVQNNLMDTTTIHWHGMHVSAMNDGGPHVVIPPGTVWNPSFTVRDHAATYWYHPHLHMMTNLHATMGAAGVVIVRDPQEAALNIPRTYGVDDFPLVLQSKCFDANKQIVVHNASDSVMLVNGTLQAYLPVPAQFIRMRLLNASSERVYNLGLQGNQSFYQMATDGGLLDAPVSLTRLRLAPGERAEILVDFSGMVGQSTFLMSYASELPNAIYGAAQPGMGPGQVIPGYTSNPLNGVNFNIMRFDVVAPTAGAITTVPAALVPNAPWPVNSANAFKTLTFSPVNMGPTAIQGPFLINNTGFDMGVVNYSIPYDNIEIWTLTNQSPIAHPFHIHAVQFYITEINGLPAPANMAGRKDVVLVPAMQTVKFITKFESFCDSMGMYMYHCHMLTHEDDGMMGQFVVSCPAGVGMDESPMGGNLQIYPNPSNGSIHIDAGEHVSLERAEVFTMTGKLLLGSNNLEARNTVLDLSHLASGVYLVKVWTSAGLMVQRISLTD
ncbi:MAG: multicopper oxidase domain-containing protein [Bacteroidia bacterium]|nr:multicopper oxidase domain-containing protein [Bacteroidia bacterium]